MALTAKAFKALSPGEQKAYLKKHPTSMHNPKNKRAGKAPTMIKAKPQQDPARRLAMLQSSRYEPEVTQKSIRLRNTVKRLEAKIKDMTTETVRPKNTKNMHGFQISHLTKENKRVLTDKQKLKVKSLKGKLKAAKKAWSEDLKVRVRKVKIARRAQIAALRKLMKTKK